MRTAVLEGVIRNESLRSGIQTSCFSSALETKECSPSKLVEASGKKFTPKQRF